MGAREHSPDLHAKVCAVTGPTTGVGRELARGLALRGATVFLLARPSQRATSVRDELSSLVPCERIRLVACDLASLASVRAAAAQVLARTDRLDVLFNNAGAWYRQRDLTVDGFERTFQVDHLGHYLLTELLLERLLAARGRVLATTSAMHAIGRVAQLDDPQAERSWSGLRAYAFGKLCNIWHMQSLASRFGSSGLHAHAFHPGGVRTPFGRSTGGGLEWVFRLSWPILTTPARAARTGLHLAAADLSSAANGSYWIRSRPAKPAPVALNPDGPARLDALSRSLLDLS
jgi:NAD(P)-dependent dehydrogenase (short-subunit alcohol dehydrogenase family)